MNSRFKVTVGDIQITSEDKALINKVLDTNRLSYGPFSRKLESTFAKIHDSKFAVLSNSGTSSLQVALAALKEKNHWNDGDEVIVPSTTFVATVNIVLQNNLKPVFADVNKDTYNIAPQEITKALTDKTRAIIPVHLLGLPAQMDLIMNIAKSNALKVIEDSCETMFAKYDGKMVGSFGDIGCFSMYIAHYIIAGVGGIATTSNPELAVMMRSLVNHGRDSIYLNIDDDNKKNREQFKEVISKRFRFERLGYSYRITEMEAALGYSQLLRYKSNVRRRKEIAAKYIKGLSDLQEHIQTPYTPVNVEHVFMLFGLVCKEDGTKQQLINYLEENDIETRDLLPLTNQPVYKELFGNNLEDKYPVSKWLNHNGFYIGCHQYLNNKDVDYVIKTFHNFWRK